jgi:superfamily I DNA and/or RNA helicase
VKLINANYGGRLTVELVRQHAARPPVSPDTTGTVLRATLLRGRVAFIDIPSEQTIKINRVEAEMAAEIAQELCEAGVAPVNIGIITPWRAQIAAVRVALRARGVPDDVAADTVERFQGSERDYIVISTCVANKYLLRRASSPSLDTQVDRKLNVALSRAREAVWILGNSAVLSESEHWHSILDHCRREGIWLRKSAR